MTPVDGMSTVFVCVRQCVYNECAMQCFRGIVWHILTHAHNQYEIIQFT